MNSHLTTVASMKASPMYHIQRHSNSSKCPTGLLNTHNMTPFKWFQLKQNYMYLSMEWHWTISPYISKYALESKAQMQTSSISITVSKLLQILIGYPRSKLAVLHGVNYFTFRVWQKIEIIINLQKKCSERQK